MKLYQHVQSGVIVQFLGWATNKEKERKAIIKDETGEMYIVDQDIFVSKETHGDKIVNKYNYLGDF